jgi:hypothetical protein
MEPTTLIAIITILMVLVTVTVMYFVLDPFSGHREKRRKARQLQNITDSLAKGMTLEEVERKYGYFDNYEMSNEPAPNSHICYIGKDNSAHISLIFVNNVLNSWRLVG